MAAKTQASDFRSILTDIRKGNFAPVYLLMGEEPYYLDKVCEALEASVVPESDRDFNATSYYGQEIDIPTVIATAQQFPMMADRRIVLVKEAQALPRAKEELDKLADYVLRPNMQSVLVVVFKGDNLNATSALLKAAAKSDAVVFKSPKLRDYQLETPVKDYAASKKISIDVNALKMIIEFIGADLSKLFGSIDKIIVAEGNPKTITADMVEKNIGISKEFNNFELQSALAYGNYVKAMQIVNYFEANPRTNPVEVTSATIFSFFSRLVMAHFLPDKSDQNLTATFGLKNAFALKDLKAAMKQYSATQSVNSIGAIREFDIHSKGVESFADRYTLLKALIYRLFTLPKTLVM